uniref:Uncharacterized protein n=1 Tax=Cacopsylla melanoneura TaxID=428564 RepID=A0A8D8V310_9HEMI
MSIFTPGQLIAYSDSNVLYFSRSRYFSCLLEYSSRVVIRLQAKQGLSTGRTIPPRSPNQDWASQTFQIHSRRCVQRRISTAVHCVLRSPQSTVWRLGTFRTALGVEPPPYDYFY